MNIEELEERLPGVLGMARKVGNPKDLIRREDAVDAVRTACIRKHIPFNSKSPEGRRALEAVWAISTIPAAIPAAELGAASGVYDRLYDRLRELLKADREGRCFVLLVAPDPYAGEGEEQVIICEDGEAQPWNVTEVIIGPNGYGVMNCVYETEGPTFQTADIGKTVFLPHEAEKIEAALAKMREEDHD